MTTYFTDSSALVKRYISENGSPWVRNIANPVSGNSLIIAQITWVEVISAVARRQREGTISISDVNKLITDFRTDFNTQYQVITLDKIITDLAGELILQYPLKAYDAVQLASAIEIQRIFRTNSAINLVFLTADNRLLNIAQTLGLVTDNPNIHP